MMSLLNNNNNNKEESTAYDTNRYIAITIHSGAGQINDFIRCKLTIHFYQNFIVN